MTSTIALRPYQSADARPVVDLLNAAGQRAIGIDRAVVDAVGNVRMSRYVPPDAERVVAVAGSDTVVGYAYLTQRDHPAIREVGGAVHPQWWGRGVGGSLLGWAQQRAAAVTLAAEGCRAVLQTNLFEGEAAALRLVQWHGFQPLRMWLHMLCELGERPPAPMLAAGLQLRPMDLDEDWEVVGPAMDAAYSRHWGAIIEPEQDAAPDDTAADDADADEEVPEDDSYSNAPGFCFIVAEGATVVGGVLCNAKLAERGDSGRIGSLFVRPSHQRRGVGRALMFAAYSAFWEHGIRRIILDTDAESFSDSPQFYAALRMREYRREWLYEREIRAGREVRRLVM